MQRILQEIMKKNNTWNSSDAWSMRQSSHRPSNPVYYIEDCRIFTVLIYIPCALLHTIGSRFAKPLIFESIRAKLISTNWWWVDNAIAEDQATTANVLEVSLTQQLNIIYVYVHFSAKHIRTLIMSVRMYSF